MRPKVPSAAALRVLDISFMFSCLVDPTNFVTTLSRIAGYRHVALNPAKAG